MSKIMIIGAGAGGTSLLLILHEYKGVDVTGIVDICDDAPGLKLAREMGIPAGNDYQKLMEQIDINIIINASGNDLISRDLDGLKANKELEIIEGHSAKILFKLVDERRKSEEKVKHRLKEHEALYKIGIMLTSSESEDELLHTILECATELTHTPAGSIALYDETDGSMEVMSFYGFSDGYTSKLNWTIRQGGLTEYILNRDEPVVIENIDTFDGADGSSIQVEGIKSLIAMPLVVERKTIGIIYVDDFVPRCFSEENKSILTLLATQAAIAIEKMQLFERVKKLAVTDGLTGLFNHRHFVSSLRVERQRAARYGHSLSVLMIDVDHFKNYNDANGHLRGNEALKGVTCAMRGVTRSMDVLARYGGEEFAVILAEANKKMARQTAERICRTVASRSIYGEEQQPLKKLTVSVGVATFPDDATTGSVLVGMADRALYEAKQQGRNRVVSYSKDLE
ncbi:GGDEF domain protein [hydrothermal vent metagenome]|uniref:GGDEF domain protein n=1 Tax=hydrothermal vent metagenome TaxID=652676 RepID=A0A3B1BGW4_9ZZZZ